MLDKESIEQELERIYRYKVSTNSGQSYLIRQLIICVLTWVLNGNDYSPSVRLKACDDVYRTIKSKELTEIILKELEKYKKKDDGGTDNG